MKTTESIASLKRNGSAIISAVVTMLCLASALGADTPATSSERAARLETARAEMALTRSNIVLTLDQLDQIRHADDPHAQFERFVEQLEKMKERAKLTQERGQAMKAKGDAYFADPAAGGDPTQAQRKAAYDRIVQQMQLARTNFTPLLAQLEQIKTLLEGERSKEKIAEAKELFMQANWRCVSVQRALMEAEGGLNKLASGLTGAAQGPAGEPNKP